MNLIGQPLAVVGLGYVGLPLAVEFGKRFAVLGFDIKPARIGELERGHDGTREVSPADLAAAVHLRFSADPAALRDSRVFIVTVPTPVDQANRPDMTPLVKASQTVGAALKPGDVVITEAWHEYGLRLLDGPPAQTYDAAIIAVAHRQFRELGVPALRAWLKPHGVLYDVKHVLPRDAVDGRL